MNRREFIAYGVGAALVGLIVVSNGIEKSKYKLSINENDHSIELKHGGLLITVKSNNNPKLLQIMDSIYMIGPRTTFIREKDNQIETFIALLEGFKKITIEHTKNEDIVDKKIEIPASRISLFKKSMLGFYYVGDKLRAEQLYRDFFQVYTKLGEIKPYQILVAAPNDIDGRRDHSKVMHIWTAANPNYVIYRDNNVDPREINRRVKMLIEEYNEKRT